MGNGVVILPPDSTGKQIDCASISVGGVTAYRQRVAIGDNTRSANFAVVSSGSLQVLVQNAVTVTGQVSVTGSVAIASLNGLGKIDGISAAVSIASLNGLGKIDGISAAVSIASLNGLGKIDGISAAVGLAAGTQHIGEVNISIMPAVVLATGTNNIGTIQAISAAVGLAAGTNNIGAVSNAAGTALMGAVSLAAGTAKIGYLSKISATVNVAGTFTIGTIDKISATAVCVNSGFYDSSAGSTTTVRVGDSANSAIRCNIVAGISSTAICVTSGFYDSSAGSTTTVACGDSANHAVRVNVVAGTLAMSGLLDGISATVNVTGSVYCTGDVKMSASNTAAVGSSLPIWLDKSGRQVVVSNNPSLPPSATHGPKYCGAISVSGGATLIASPGAGKSLFLTNINYSNLNAATGTILFIYEGSATATPILVAWVPSNNAGKSINYDPPVRVSSGTALSGKVKPNVDGIPVNIHFYTGID